MAKKIRGARVKVVWFGDRVARGLGTEFIRRLKIVGSMLERSAKKDLSIPGRSVGPSSPGEFPHAQTGDLRKSIFNEVQERRKVVILGTTMRHGLYLEVGTKHMDSRPFLRMTVANNRREIIRILTAKMKFIPGVPKKKGS